MQGPLPALGLLPEQQLKQISEPGLVWVFFFLAVKLLMKLID